MWKRLQKQSAWGQFRPSISKVSEAKQPATSQPSHQLARTPSQQSASQPTSQLASQPNPASQPPELGHASLASNFLPAEASVGAPRSPQTCPVEPERAREWPSLIGAPSRALRPRVVPVTLIRAAPGRTAKSFQNHKKRVVSQAYLKNASSQRHIRKNCQKTVLFPCLRNPDMVLRRRVFYS